MIYFYFYGSKTRFFKTSIVLKKGLFECFKYFSLMRFIECYFSDSIRWDFIEILKKVEILSHFYVISNHLAIIKKVFLHQICQFSYLEYIQLSWHICVLVVIYLLVLIWAHLVFELKILFFHLNYVKNISL